MANQKREWYVVEYDNNFHGRKFPPLYRLEFCLVEDDGSVHIPGEASMLGAFDSVQDISDVLADMGKAFQRPVLNGRILQNRATTIRVKP